MNKKVALIVCDGFGYSKKVEGNAVLKAKMPYYDKLLKKYPNTFLRASGRFVGLKNGQMGNSETGHMNIGAGRIVCQDLTKIDNMIFDDTLKDNKALVNFLTKIKKLNGNVHFLGLLSNGGVHSHIDHLFALIKIAKNFGIKDCYIHVITDGRDTDMHSAINFVKQLEKLLKQLNYGKIATIQGRFYIMDRDKKYENTFEGYNAVINRKGVEIESPIKYLKRSYENDITDEYLVPAVVFKDGKPIFNFDNNKDGMMFYNYRKDRTKQVSEAFLLDNFDKFETPYKLKNYLTMTNYGDEFKCETVIKREIVEKGLVDMLSRNGKKIAKFSEPTKFPHITYFLNGGRETPFENEEWFKVPAKNVKTFDMAPEMSAIEVANEIEKQCDVKDFDFVMTNFANCDMVGHTGNFDATVKALETIDKSLSIAVEYLKNKGFDILLTADHGNCEQMIYRGKVCTTHSNNPVRLIYITDENVKLKKGTLVDLSPTILNIFGIDSPKEYTGKNLIIRKK